MKISKYHLGIETSCDDTSVAILKESESQVEVLSHLKFGQEESLKKWGGVVPEIAARNHLEKITDLLQQTFETTNLEPSQITQISVTAFPGLLGPLLTGINAAKTLSLIHKLPIFPVNHLYAHLEAIHLTQEIKYPYLGILLSGGHSLFFWVSSSTEFKIIGKTIDDASGEAFDKGGKILGLGYPAGHIIDKLAQFGDENKYSFPIGLKSSADANMSFSGLKTALRVFLDKNPEVLNLRPKDFTIDDSESKDFYDVCASYQNAIVKAILLKLRYALKTAKEIYPGDFPIVVGGGVACNSALRRELIKKYPQTYFVDPEFCTDNAAMIANYGMRNQSNAIAFPECLTIDAKSRFINKGQNVSKG